MPSEEDISEQYDRDQQRWNEAFGHVRTPQQDYAAQRADSARRLQQVERAEQQRVADEYVARRAQDKKDLADRLAFNRDNAKLLADARQAKITDQLASAFREKADPRVRLQDALDGAAAKRQAAEARVEASLADWAAALDRMNEKGDA